MTIIWSATSPPKPNRSTRLNYYRLMPITLPIRFPIFRSRTRSRVFRCYRVTPLASRLLHVQLHVVCSDVHYFVDREDLDENLIVY